MRRLSRSRQVFACLSIPTISAFSGCDNETSSSPALPDPSCPQAAASPDFAIVPTPLTTTSPNIAVGNLSAQLVGYESLRQVDPTDVARSRTVIELRLTRAQFIGITSDFTEALAIAEAAVDANPDDADAHLLHARVLTALHRWNEAHAALDLAATSGADAESVQRSRDTIDVAVGSGDLEAILSRAELWTETAPGASSHGARANALWKLGRYAEADKAFQAAMASYRDVAPWVVAWSDFQRGVMWSESANRPDLAAPLYAAAVARLPHYHVAVVHHSELLVEEGKAEEAIALLSAVVESAEDPEAKGLLATLLRENGEPERAAVLRAEAKAAYEALLETHRAAYAEHGAEFFLNVVDEPEVALTLALENLADRPNSGAFELAVSAALAAMKTDDACELVERARREASPTPVFCEVMHEASASCR